MTAELAQEARPFLEEAGYDPAHLVSDYEFTSRSDDGGLFNQRADLVAFGGAPHHIDSSWSFPSPCTPHTVTSSSTRTTTSRSLRTRRSTASRSPISGTRRLISACVGSSSGRPSSPPRRSGWARLEATALRMSIASVTVSGVQTFTPLARRAGDLGRYAAKPKSMTLQVRDGYPK